MIKTYKETFTTGLISTMKEVDDVKFNEIFGDDYDAELLDDFIVFNIGDCYVNNETYNLVSSNKIDTVAKFVWLRFYNDWKTLLKTLTIDYEKTYSETITRDTSRKTTENNTSNNTVNNKVFAYDSETASNDTLEDSTTDSTINNDNNENTTQIKSGYNYGNSLIDIIKKYYDYNIESNFIDVVISDIKSLTTYSIV